MIGTFLVLSAATLGALQQTDTTFSAEGARRLDLEVGGGTVAISTWDRDEIHLRAEHSRRAEIAVQRRGEVLYLESESDRGMGSVVDYVLTIPRTMDITVEGFRADVQLDGVGGTVEVSNVEGNITVVGGRGRVTLESVNGRVSLTGAEGTMNIGSVAANVTVRDSSGDITAESVGGSVTLEGIRSARVEASSVGGAVIYAGTIQDGGDYFFSTHGGRVELTLPPGINATVSLASVMGSVSATYTDARADGGRKGRVRYTIGTGSAVVEAETFGGAIRMREAGSR